MTPGLLYGWELGGGASHLELARGLLAALGGRFGRVTLALRHLASAQARFGAGPQLFQAPVPEPAGQLPNPASYAEILFEAGFHDRDALLSRLRAWDAILDAARPDVVVADHAPTLLLASRGRAGLKRCCIGAGFFCPPPVAPGPVFRSWERVPPARPEAVEARVLEAINAALQQRGVAPLARLADLFALDEQFLTTTPELDHYPARGPARYWGFYATSDGGGRMPDWPAGEGPRVFAYLSAGYPRLAELLAELVRLRWPSVVHVTGLPEATRRSLAAPTLHLTGDWLDMAGVTAAADLVVCHAGAGTMGWALEQGRRLVTLPLHAEQTVAALRLKAAGLGHALLSADPAQFRRTLRVAAEDTGLQSRVDAFRSRLHPSRDNLAAIAARLGELAA